MHALIVCLKYASDDNSTLELKCLGFCCITHSFSLHLSKDITVLTGVVTSSQITFCLYHRSYRHLLRICKTYCFFFHNNTGYANAPYCCVMHALIVCLKYASDDNSTLELKCLGFCCITHPFSLHQSKDITVLTGVVTSSQITFCLYHRSYRHLLRICKTYCFFFPRQHWLRERALLLRYACIDCLFEIRFR